MIHLRIRTALPEGFGVYLIDRGKRRYLSEDEEIELNFSSNVSPCVVKPVEGDSYIYLILPVRIYGA